jgi:hypothetical protein
MNVGHTGRKKKEVPSHFADFTEYLNAQIRDSIEFKWIFI